MNDEEATTPEEDQLTTDLSEVAQEDPPEIDADDDLESQDDPDELAEVEFEGAKYRVPAALEGALLRQADYTQKTQEVAELRKQTEAREKSIAEYAKAINEDLQEHAQLMAIDTQLKGYDGLNWEQLRMEDPEEYQNHRDRLQDLRYAHAQLKEALQVKHRERTSKAEAEMATLREQTRAELVRSIPNYSPKLEQGLKALATRNGFDEATVAAAFDTNPAAIKVLHLAYVGQQLLDKQKAASKEVTAEPVKQVRGGKSSNASALPKDSDDMATWLKKEEARLARKHA